MTTTRQGVEDVRRYEYIDVLRGVAILGVIAIHCGQHVDKLSPVVAALFNYGQMGVQLFFVASALTLCLSAAERKELSLAGFYVRRFFRIAPLYYFGIAFYFAWRLALGSLAHGRLRIPDDYSLRWVAENLLFVHGFHPANFNFMVPGGWSISTEMTFYLIFPLLYALLTRLTLRTFILLAVGVAASSFVAQYVVMTFLQPHLLTAGILKTVIENDEFNFLYASLINQINVFMIGLITYRCLKKRVGSGHLLVAAALIAVGFLVLNDHHYDTGYDGFIYPILSALAFAIIAVRLSARVLADGPVSRLLASVGQNSYSMYLMHFAAIDVVVGVLSLPAFDGVGHPELRLAIAYPAVVALAYLVAGQTRRIIEEPGIRLGKILLAGRRVGSSGVVSATAAPSRAPRSG